MLKFLSQCSHILLKLDAFLFFVVIFCKTFQVNFWDLLILAVELVKFQHGIRLALSVWCIVAKFIRFSMLLNANFITLFTAAQVEPLATVYLYAKETSYNIMWKIW